MAVLERGPAPPPKGKGRAVLSVRDPLVESLLRGLGFEDSDIDDLRRFCKSWVRERNSWDVGRRGGLFSGSKLDKSDADRALKRALAEIGGVE
jgi:hypothetical protein